MSEIPKFIIRNQCKSYIYRSYCQSFDIILKTLRLEIDYASERNDTVDNDREIDRAYRHDNVVKSTKGSIDVM